MNYVYNNEEKEKVVKYVDDNSSMFDIPVKLTSSG